MKTIYLDYAAATPVDPEVLKAMLPYFSEKFYNPSAQYTSARQTQQDLQAARSEVAGVLGAKASEIIFTAGATEANNLAIHGIMQQYPGANMVVLAIEHDAVLEPAKNYQVKYAPVKPDGRVDLDALDKLIDDQTVLVSIMHANNEIGVVQPLSDVAKIIATKRRGRSLPLLLHTDASQSANYLDLHVSRLGVDMMTLNGGKMYGPKQTGALFVKSSVKLLPQITGGGQERGLRSGTENLAGIVGFSKALTLAQKLRKDEGARLQKLQALFINLLAQKLPKALVNGSLKFRLPNNIHITIPGTDNERLIILLDGSGIMCAAGSACSASKEEASHVLKALGLDDSSARASLRFTMGRSTTEADVKLAVETLAKVLS